MSEKFKITHIDLDKMTTSRRNEDDHDHMQLSSLKKKYEDYKDTVSTIGVTTIQKMFRGWSVRRRICPKLKARL